MWFGAWYGVCCVRLSASGHVGLSGRIGKKQKEITGMPADGSGDPLRCRVGYFLYEYLLSRENLGLIREMCIFAQNEDIYKQIIRKHE